MLAVPVLHPSRREVAVLAVDENPVGLLEAEVKVFGDQHVPVAVAVPLAEQQHGGAAQG